MKLTEDQKKSILKALLKTIECIADKDYQKRIWIRGEGPEVDDFTETVCYFFDICDPLLEESKEFPLSEAQEKILRQFSHDFSEFSDHHTYEPEFIDSPEWQMIVDEAKNVLKVFNYSI